MLHASHAAPRLTFYGPDGTPASRWTLALEAEGREVSWVPEVTRTEGGLPDQILSQVFRGFRPELICTWSVGIASRLEMWDGAAWMPAAEAPTAAALLGALQASEAQDVWVEPFGPGYPDHAFGGRAFGEPVKLRDRKGVAHMGLELRITGSQLVGVIPAFG